MTNIARLATDRAAAQTWSAPPFGILVQLPGLASLVRGWNKQDLLRGPSVSYDTTIATRKSYYTHTHFHTPRWNFTGTHTRPHTHTCTQTRASRRHTSHVISPCT